MVLLGGLMVSKGFLRSLALGGVTLPNSEPVTSTSPVAVPDTDDEGGVVVDELATTLEGGGGGREPSNLTFAGLPAAATATNKDEVAAGEDFLLFLLALPSEVVEVLPAADFSLSGVSSLVGWCLRMCSTNLSDLMVPNWQLGTLHWYLSAFLSCW